MKLRAQIHLATLSALIAVGTVAAADVKGGDRAAMFGTIDTDGNGEISQAEMQAHAAARFAAADTDGDGLLSAEEMQSARAERRSMRSGRMIEEHDTDGDGKLDAAELEKAFEGWGEGRSEGRMGRMMARMDTNEDGKLSLEEMSAHRDPAKMFGRLDADGNGTLSPEEFGKMEYRGMGRHGAMRHHGYHGGMQGDADEG